MWDQHIQLKIKKGSTSFTCTVHQWVDVFIRKEYVEILLESIRFCQNKKGLKIYAWDIITNHIHMIVGSDKENLSDIIRDFKKYTSRKILKRQKIILEKAEKGGYCGF